MRETYWDAKMVNHFVQEVRSVLVVRTMIRGPMGRVLILVNFQLRDKYFNLSTLN
jgi:hypothetical protein